MADHITTVAKTLSEDIYQANFRGKKRGRFCLTRDQVRRALGVKRLHASTIAKLQDAALEHGLVIVDLDDLFPCIETGRLRRLRRPPAAIFEEFFSESDDSESDDSESDDEFSDGAFEDDHDD